jgi:hypothetical protein
VGRGGDLRQQGRVVIVAILVPIANVTKAYFSGGDHHGLGWFWWDKKKDKTENEELSFRVIAIKSTFLNPLSEEKISSHYSYVLHNFELN